MSSTASCSVASPFLAASPLDMYTPAQTCAELAVSETVLLDMVNTGRLGAYNLGGNIRFKVVDVHAASGQLIGS